LLVWKVNFLVNIMPFAGPFGTVVQVHKKVYP
jgi:hypothetical protein